MLKSHLLEVPRLQNLDCNATHGLANIELGVTGVKNFSLFIPPTVPARACSPETKEPAPTPGECASIRVSGFVRLSVRV